MNYLIIGLTPSYQQITQPDRLSTPREPLSGKSKAPGASSATPSVYRPRADRGSNPGHRRERLVCYPLHHRAPPPPPPPRGGMVVLEETYIPVNQNLVVPRDPPGEPESTISLLPRETSFRFMTAAEGKGLSPA